MTDFPKVTITGGPHGKDVEVRVNGDRLPKTHRVELVLDVNDVVRMKTFQFAQANVELNVPPVAAERLVRLEIFNVEINETPDDTWTRSLESIAVVDGKDLPSCLRAAADVLAAKEIEVGVVQ